MNIGEIKEIHVCTVIPSTDIEMEETKEEETKDEQVIDVEALYEEKLKEAELQINDQLAEAKREADEIVQRAQQEAMSVLEKARQEGYVEGKEVGYDEGKRSADAIIQEALQIKEHIQSQKVSMTKEIEKDVNALIIQIVENILNMKVQDCEDVIMGLVKLGLDKCTYTDHLVIRVSPEDYGFAMASKDKILCLAENISDLEIKQDASLNKGSCVIDTISGSVDSSVETQLQYIKDIFLELLESE